jgi:6-phosphogluconolactonase
MRTSPLLLVAAAALAACSDATTSLHSLGANQAPALNHLSQTPVGGVFTQTNSPAGNEVVAFSRAADGTLSLLGTYATGGLGVGGTVDPLVSQYALTLSPDARFLFVVNAGSNEISSFAVSKQGVTLVDKVPSGGVRPVSIAATNGVLYALNTASNTLAGFRIQGDGRLTPVPTWTRSLSASAVGAAAVRFTPRGDLLAVANRASQTIDTYRVHDDGALSEAVANPSSGAGPFGFDFTDRGVLVSSEAGAGAASSYVADGSGVLRLVSASTPTLQRAPCWLIVTRNGEYAYTANAGSGTLTGFSISRSGELSRLAADGVSANLGDGTTPLDLDASRDGRFVYVLEAGTGAISAWAVKHDGSLDRVGATPAVVARSGQMGLASY